VNDAAHARHGISRKIGAFFEEIAEDIAFVLGQEAAHGRMIDGKDLQRDDSNANSLLYVILFRI